MIPILLINLSILIIDANAEYIETTSKSVIAVTQNEVEEKDCEELIISAIFFGVIALAAIAISKEAQIRYGGIIGVELSIIGFIVSILN